ncbi:hypothetical protein EYF80_041264 [Liparis tanakae]|uniref:Uncharacterized protein n=1 Tax=Liparis tanakae TaxID=230148 RepID=A0A4Z2G5V0_9TELE|nr:hypothetical protein EYF80_041264 [Liparis tanakae]
MFCGEQGVKPMACVQRQRMTHGHRLRPSSRRMLRLLDLGGVSSLDPPLGDPCFSKLEPLTDFVSGPCLPERSSWASVSASFPLSLSLVVTDRGAGEAPDSPGLSITLQVRRCRGERRRRTSSGSLKGIKGQVISPPHVPISSLTADSSGVAGPLKPRESRA